MRRTLALLLAMAVVAGCTSATAGIATPAISPTTSTTASADPSGSTLTAIGAGLSGPAGLSATVYATGLANVSAFAFDPEGHLWAATAAYDDAGTDAVYESRRAGATPVKVIADLHTPLGLLWSGDTLYVASAGRVEAYTGFDDGDVRTPRDGPDAAGRRRRGQRPRHVDRRAVSSSASRRRATRARRPPRTPPPSSRSSPTASDLQVVAGGIRAPVGLAYYPGTDDLFVTMNQRDDLGDATPGDWLSVVRYGQAWGFPDCYGQGGSACVGAPTPVAVLDKHAAVSGVAIVTGGLGASIGPSALVAEWATGVVLAWRSTHDGATYTGTVEPFLTGLTQPVPVVTAPDGAVFVGDWGTGTVYRIAAA